MVNGDCKWWLILILDFRIRQDEMEVKFPYPFGHSFHKPEEKALLLCLVQVS